MDPEAGDVVRERLDAFLAYATAQHEPTDEGWQLFRQLDQAIDDMAEAYEPTPKHLADATPEAPTVEAGRDNWFVAIFDGWNQDEWDRRPGDTLTFWQKFTIVGQIVTILLVIGMAVGLVVLMSAYGDEWQPGRTQ